MPFPNVSGGTTTAHCGDTAAGRGWTWRGQHCCPHPGLQQARPSNRQPTFTFTKASWVAISRERKTASCVSRVGVEQGVGVEEEHLHACAHTHTS